MTLSEKIQHIRQSEISKLVFDGKVLGLRIKIFNAETESFEYGDFELETITDNRLIGFVKGIRGMNSIELHRKDGLLVSDIEETNGVVVDNITDPEAVLSTMEVIYSVK